MYRHFVNYKIRTLEFKFIQFYCNPNDLHSFTKSKSVPTYINDMKIHIIVNP